MCFERTKIKRKSNVIKKRNYIEQINNIIQRNRKYITVTNKSET